MFGTEMPVYISFLLIPIYVPLFLVESLLQSLVFDVPIAAIVLGCLILSADKQQFIKQLSKNTKQILHVIFMPTLFLYAVPKWSMHITRDLHELPKSRSDFALPMIVPIMCAIWCEFWAPILRLRETTSYGCWQSIALLVFLALYTILWLCVGRKQLMKNAVAFFIILWIETSYALVCLLNAGMILTNIWL